MPHDCLDFWGNHAKRLTGLLRRETAAQRRLVDSGTGRRPLRPYEGWVHRAADEADYDRLVKLHYEMCLALKQPTDIPTHWGRTEVKKKKAGSVDAAAIGSLARKVLDGLAQDGAAVDSRTGLPEHSLDGVPRYGTPNWLEKPEDPGKHGKRESLPVARALLQELRAAMAR